MRSLRFPTFLGVELDSARELGDEVRVSQRSSGSVYVAPKVLSLHARCDWNEFDKYFVSR